MGVGAEEDEEEGMLVDDEVRAGRWTGSSVVGASCASWSTSLEWGCRMTRFSGALGVPGRGEREREWGESGDGRDEAGEGEGTTASEGKGEGCCPDGKECESEQPQ